MLTKVTLTRDQWNHLVRLFHIVNFSMFSCSHVFSSQNSKHLAEEDDAGKSDRRRACIDAIEASEFDTEKIERESISHDGFWYMKQPGELWIWLEFWYHKSWETRTKRKRRFSVKFWSVTQRWQSFSRYREIGTTGTESIHRSEVEPPQTRKLKYSMYWVCLRECYTQVESSRRRPDGAGPKSQCFDMGIIHVTNNESNDTCRSKWWQHLVHRQEDSFRGVKTVFDITQKLILN